MFKSHPLDLLKLADFQGIFETGYEILENASQYFSHKENQQRMRLLESLNHETNQFENSFKIFDQLKSEAFKDYYWQVRCW